MKIFYSNQFVLPLPAGHRFPMQKYALLQQRVVATKLVAADDLCEAPVATDAEIERAHDDSYLRRVVGGELTAPELRRIGFPWSSQVVARERRVAGATIAACRAALADGAAVNIAGGTHHAFRDYGAGYCVFNDGAIAARTMQAEGRARRVVIIDTDVHQGDGTAAILAEDRSIFTFSIHGARNYPFYKQQSDLDIALDDGVDDATYLTMLEEGVRYALALARADLAIYVAGADPYLDDQLGRLSVSKAGLAERDQIVLAACRAAGLPLAITMGGGYARTVEDIVDIHFQTICAAAEQ
jgi:acetoin utilization deacetylase AcuC-like enzyme